MEGFFWHFWLDEGLPWISVIEERRQVPSTNVIPNEAHHQMYFLCNIQAQSAINLNSTITYFCLPHNTWHILVNGVSSQFRIKAVFQLILCFALNLALFNYNYLVNQSKAHVEVKQRLHIMIKVQHLDHLPLQAVKCKAWFNSAKWS